MSFNSLKQNKSSIFNKLQKQLEDTTKVGTTDERMWKLTTDKAGNGFAVIRFLPASDGEDMPFVKLYNHGFQGPGGWYIENSLTTLGKDDPLGEYNRELWNSGDESLKEQVRKQKRKLSYYANVYIVKDTGNPDNEGQVKIFRFGKKIYDKIMDAVNGDELEGREGINPFDFWAGANFKLRAKKVAGYPNYDSSEFQDTGVLDDLDDAQLESIWKRQHPLQSIVAEDQFKTYDQLKERLDKVLNLQSSGSTERAPARTAETVVSTKPSFSSPSVSEDTVGETEQEVVVPQSETSSSNEEGEGDVLDYFRSLAES
jgi:hypothetical protein